MNKAERRLQEISKRVKEYKTESAKRNGSERFERERCVQTIKPISSLIESIYSFTQNSNEETFTFIFGEMWEFYFDAFNKIDKDFFRFYKGLSVNNKVKLANFIEGITPDYDVVNLVDEKDLERFLMCDNNLLSSLVREVNQLSYRGTLDEPAVLQWVARNRNTIKN